MRPRASFVCTVAVALAGAIAAAAVAPAAAGAAIPQDAPTQARLERARDFGYRVGDLLTLQAVVRAPRGWELDPQSLRSGALPAGIELRDASAEAERIGDAVEYRVRFTYQVFVVADSVTRLQVPARELLFRSARREEAARATVPAFAFTVTPLTGTATAMEPDWPVPPPSLRGLALAGGSLFLLLGTWGALEIVERRRRKRRVFWRANREIRDEPDCGRAMLTLHRALEAAAGRALFGSDLEWLEREWPPAARVRDDLARFFELSEGLFFGNHGTRVPDDCLPWLRELAGRLQDLERRHGAAGAGAR